MKDGVVVVDGGPVLVLHARGLAQVAAPDHGSVADVGEECHTNGKQGS